MVGDVHSSMRALVLDAPHQKLIWRSVPVPELLPDQVLVKVSACGVCRTDLHIVDGELDNPKLPLILGHEVVVADVAASQQWSRTVLPLLSGVPLQYAGIGSSIMPPVSLSASSPSAPRRRWSERTIECR